MRRSSRRRAVERCRTNGWPTPLRPARVARTRYPLASGSTDARRAPRRGRRAPGAGLERSRVSLQRGLEDGTRTGTRRLRSRSLTQHRVGGDLETAPIVHTSSKRAFAGLRELVVAAARGVARCLYPVAGPEPLPLESSQGGVDRPFGQIDCSLCGTAKLGHDLVSIHVATMEKTEDQQPELAPGQLRTRPSRRAHDPVPRTWSAGVTNLRPCALDLEAAVSPFGVSR